jgi:uncharacterized protein (TIGR00730 family)
VAVSESTRRRYQVPDAGLERDLEALIERVEALSGRSDSFESVRQLLVTALRLVSDGASRADLKLISNAVKELRHAFRVFAPYRQIRKVAVFGSARTQPGEPAFEQARAFAQRIAAAGWMLITGAGDGIMGAAQEGAGRAASFGVSIRLPWEQRANAVIAGDPKLVNFRYFFTRKVIFVKEAHAIALFPGGFGTHDEGFEALTLIQTGRSEIVPVVFVDAPGGHYWREWAEYVDAHLRAPRLIGEADAALYRITDDVGEAVREITGFYRNYHSSRFVGERLVLRVRTPPDPAQLEALNERFADLLLDGRIERSEPLPQESAEATGCARLALHFDRRQVGRLRQLIDQLNAWGPPEPARRDATPREIVEGVEDDATD